MADFIDIGLRTGDLIPKALKTAASLLKIDEAQLKLVQTTQRLNKNLDKPLMTKFVIESDKGTRALIKFNKELDHTSRILQTQTIAQQKAIQKQQELQRLREQVRGKIDARFGAPETADTKTANQITRTKERLVELISEYKVGGRVIEGILKDIHAGHQRTMIGPLAQVRQQLAQLVLLYKKVDTSIPKPSPTQELGELKTPYDSAIFFDPKRAFNSNRAIAQLDQLRLKHKITAEQINGMWGNVQTGNVRQYVGVLGQVALAMRRVVNANNTLVAATQEQDESLRSVTLSWQSFVRIIGVQLIHNAVYRLINNLQEGARQAIELEKRISEIQTIDEQRLGFTVIRDQILNLSNAFGVDIVDQTTAAYEALSNQVGTTSELFRFLAESNKFAITTVTSAEDSVNLLTAALNAYGDTVNQVERVSATFFKLIDLGRVRANEMANTVGQILVPASQLGITLDEISAALAVATIRGIKYDQAATLIRNILQKLIRPSEEMKSLFREIGVSSGEAAIQAFGLGGLLGEIEKRAHGSSTELGELFINIRAIQGGLVFAGKGLEEYNATLGETKNGLEAYKRAQDLTLNNAGKRLETELNKIRNYFKVELGDNLLRLIARVTNGFGGLSEVLKILANTAKVLVIPAILGIGYALSGVVATPIGALVTGVGALAIAIGYATTRIKTLDKQAKEFHSNFVKNVDESAAAIDKKLGQRLQFISEQLLVLSRRSARVTSGILANIVKVEDTQITSFENLQKASDEYFTAYIKNLSEVISRARTEYNGLVNDIKNRQKDLVKFNQELVNKVFDIKLSKLPVDNQILSLLKRQEKLQAVANNQAQIGDREKFDTAYKLIIDYEERIQQLLKERESKSDKIGRFRIKELDEVKRLEAIYKDYNKQTKILIDTEDQLADQGQTNIRTMEIRTKFVQDLQKSLLDFNLKNVLKEGDTAKSLEAIEEQIKALQQYFTLQKRLNVNILDRRVALQRLEILNQAKQLQLQKQISEQQEKTTQERVENAKTLVKTNNEERQKELDFVRELQKNINLVTVQPVVSQVSRTRRGRNTYENTAGIFSEVSDAPFEQVKELVNLVKEFAASPTKTAQTTLLTSLIEFNKTIKDVSDQRDDVINFVDTLRNLETQLQGFGERSLPYVDVLRQIQLRTMQLNSTSAFLTQQIGSQSGAYNALNIALGNVSSAKDVEISKTYALARATQQLNATLFNNLTLQQRRVQGQELGIRRQHGGFIPKGTDTVPAMLSPGEFVVNAKSTRRFYSQLVNINAHGLRGFATGGPVTQVGDIHLNMQSSGNEQYDVLKLGNKLKTEIRRRRLSF